MMPEKLDAPRMSPLEDRWLPPAEAAKYLGVEVGTLSKWRLRGVGPLYTAALGRDPRYQLSELIAYMSSKIAANTREARAVRRDHQAYDGRLYTMRRPKRPAR